MTVQEMIKKTEYDVVDDCKSICIYAKGSRVKVFTITKTTFDSDDVYYMLWVVSISGEAITLMTYKSIDDALDLIKKLTCILDTVYVNSYSLDIQKQG